MITLPVANQPDLDDAAEWGASEHDVMEDEDSMDIETPKKLTWSTTTGINARRLSAVSKIQQN